MDYPKPLDTLIAQLQQLPGVGQKTATRHAFALLAFSEETCKGLATAIDTLHASLTRCERCHAIDEKSPCAICESPRRDPALLCVVEETDDVWAIERTAAYQGCYHVLGGQLSPLDGVGPDELNIASLLSRVEGVDEVILATNPTTEGQATALYLAGCLAETGVTVTQLAHGIPFGGDLDYVDTLTLSKALQGRRAP